MNNDFSGDWTKRFWFSGFFAQPDSTLLLGTLRAPRKENIYMNVTIAVAEDASPQKVGEEFAKALKVLQDAL